jgi:outer membrane protein TolC
MKSLFILLTATVAFAQSSLEPRTETAEELMQRTQKAPIVQPKPVEQKKQVEQKPVDIKPAETKPVDAKPVVVETKKETKKSAKSILALGEFLDQVKGKNEGYKGAQLKAEGAEQRNEEGDLLTSPQFFFDLKWADDQSEQTNPALGSRTLFHQYQVGLMQQTPIGLNAKLYYDTKYTDVTNPSPTFMPIRSYNQSRTVFEGNLSLWRNLFGKEVRSTQDAMEASAKATQYQESFTAKATIAEAEVTYWRLALARKLKVISGENLDRALKLRDWNNGRVRSGLGDRSELLQAEGNFRLRKLEFKSAEDEERNASLMFNGQRGVNSDKVTEALDLLPDSKSEFFKVPPKKDQRDDVKALLEGTKAAQAAAEVGAQKVSPNLELYGLVAYNGFDREADKAYDEAFKNDYPTTAIGVRLSIPLNVIDATDSYSGYKKEAAAADYKYQRKMFEQERDWNDLVNRYGEVKERLALAEAFEDSQKEKYDYERSRHGKGRTTTFMVLQFEQDYALAQSTRLRIQGEMLGLVAQMKTYGDVL